MAHWTASPGLAGASLVLTAASGHSGVGWEVAAVVVAVFAGIFLAGLYGDVVVGAVIFGIAAVLETAARLIAQALRKLRSSPRHRPARSSGRYAASVGGRLP
jgi:hypothetical protein